MLMARSLTLEAWPKSVERPISMPAWKNSWKSGGEIVARPTFTYRVYSYIVAPRGRHSAKPPEARTRIERLMGVECLPGLEMFAREDVGGWTCIGDEITGNDIAIDL